MSKRLDLTGRRFGKLTAVRPTEERRYGSVVWDCKCDCGNTTLVQCNNLINGITKSCGCLKIKDLTGQRFGRLTVIGATEKRSGTNIVWECKCDCGNTAYIKGESLQRGQSRSCGCFRKDDLTGQRFGMLVAIRPTEERRNSHVIWECRCDCGKTIQTMSSSLVDGKTRSCGCTRRRDITGQRFGKLIAIRPTEKRYGRNVIWECKCDCGNLADVVVGNLLSGNTQSCGCLRSRKNG